MIRTDENVAALRKALEHITAHPDEWDQTNWLVRTRRNVCGTAGCLAGHIVLQAGYTPEWHGASASNVTVDGERYSVRDLAALLTGLSDGDASLLFRGSLDLEQLWRNASLITRGAIQVPIQFQDSREI